MFIYTYTLLYLMSQLINVSDDVYDELTRLKGKESYSKVIRTLMVTTSNKEKVLALFGKGGIDEKVVKEVSHLWKQWSDKYA